MTESQLYDMFQEYLDNTIPAIILPSIGNIPTQMILASDLLSDWRETRGNGKYFIDALFEEWLKDTYGVACYTKWRTKGFSNVGEYND